MERATAPREPRPGNISDFRGCNSHFCRHKEPLDAEQWLVGTINLLREARVSEADQVEVIKIQLTDVARTWWLAKEKRLEEPITLEQFTDSFYERFFPRTFRREMKQYSSTYDNRVGQLMSML